jgi:hypothetical protein
MRKFKLSGDYDCSGYEGQARVIMPHAGCRKSAWCAWEVNMESVKDSGNSYAECSGIAKKQEKKAPVEKKDYSDGSD